MTSPRCAAALAAVAALSLILTGCVTSKQAQERAERADQIHEDAPQEFIDGWEAYLTQARERYSILALDKNLNGMGWVYCTSGCQELFGNQNRTLKSLWANKAISECKEAVREYAPAIVPNCKVYAIKDKIVWTYPLPWKTGYSDPSQRREPIASAGKLSTRPVSTTWQGYDDILNGRVSFETGGSAVAPKRIVMVLDDGKLTCGGTYTPARSQWKIACSNGREAIGRFIGLGQGKGARGEGTDNLGNMVQFIMGAE